MVFVGSNLRLTTHKENTCKKGEAKQWDVEPESTDLEAHFDALAIDDDNDDHNDDTHNDVDADPEATTETTDASGINCASNLQLSNDDEFFGDFSSHD